MNVVSTTRFGAAVLALAASLAFTPIAFARQQPSPCAAAGSLAPLAGVSEASGLAASRCTPGRFWTHNDSGSQPVLFAIDSGGVVAGQVTVTGAKLRDWEASASGACGNGWCLYLADIGDNEGQRRNITVYQVPEPEQPGGSVAVAAAFHATYPDSPQDAETLLIADGRFYIVTKGDTGAVAVYRFPPQPQPGSTSRLERVGEAAPPTVTKERVTDGSVSSNGKWIVLRSKSTLAFYRATDLLSGKWQAASTVDVTRLNEPQGEGVAFAAGNVVVLAGEAGGKGKAGTFAQFSCALPE